MSVCVCLCLSVSVCLHTLAHENMQFDSIPVHVYAHAASHFELRFFITRTVHNTLPFSFVRSSGCSGCHACGTAFVLGTRGCSARCRTQERLKPCCPKLCQLDSLPCSGGIIPDQIDGIVLLGGSARFLPDTHTSTTADCRLRN